MRRAKLGFTLLEVMVAMAILSLSITAMVGITTLSYDESHYARALTTATLLARSKMIDIELLLQKDGFSDSDKEESGDFSEEGFPEYRWEAAIRPVKLDVTQMIRGMFGGEVSPDLLPKEMAGFIGAAQGESADQLTQNVEGSDLKQMLGGQGLDLLLNQAGELLSKSIREIALEVHWGDPKFDGESVRFVQYVTTNGRISYQSPNIPANLLNQLPGTRNQNTATPPNLPGLNPKPKNPFRGIQGGTP